MIHRLRSIWIRVRGLHRQRQEDDFDAELASHIDMHTDDGVRAGLDPEEARRQALIRLGGVEQTRQAHRERRMLMWFENLSSDARYSFRILLRNPGFAGVAVLSLALGIGATTAMFSLIYAVLLHPFPYAGADRIMDPTIVDQRHPDDWTWFALSWVQFDELRRAIPVDQALGFNASNMEVTNGALPEQITGVYLTENADAFFGVRPLIGRNIQPSDGKDGGRPVVVLNYRFWQSRFGGDQHVVGQSLEIDHRPYTIIGVMPRSFAFNNTTGIGDVYLPGELMRGTANLPFLAYLPWIKLRAGVTSAAASAALEPIVREFAKEHSERFPEHWHLALQPVIVPYR